MDANFWGNPLYQATKWHLNNSSFYEDVPLVEFMYLVFTHMPGESYCRRLRSFLLYLCYTFCALINSLVCWLWETSAGVDLDKCVDRPARGSEVPAHTAGLCCPGLLHVTRWGAGRLCWAPESSPVLCAGQWASYHLPGAFGFLSWFCFHLFVFIVVVCICVCGCVCVGGGGGGGGERQFYAILFFSFSFPLDDDRCSQEILGDLDWYWLVVCLTPWQVTQSTVFFLLPLDDDGWLQSGDLRRPGLTLNDGDCVFDRWPNLQSGDLRWPGLTLIWLWLCVWQVTQSIVRRPQVTWTDIKWLWLCVWQVTQSTIRRPQATWTDIKWLWLFDRWPNLQSGDLRWPGLTLNEGDCTFDRWPNLQSGDLRRPGLTSNDCDCVFDRWPQSTVRRSRATWTGITSTACGRNYHLTCAWWQRLWAWRRVFWPRLLPGACPARLRHRSEFSCALFSSMILRTSSLLGRCRITHCLFALNYNEKISCFCHT